jgi:tRNA(His) 5'-end guanylyltransferase
MSINDELGARMKTFYEEIPKTKLMRRTPVAIRIDGKAFHTFTRGFEKPFDDILIKSMQETMKYLCENIQGCVLGYTQSDEITLILVDYKKLNSSAWFDYEVQKMCSIAASMATMAFNRIFTEKVKEYCHRIPCDEDGCLSHKEYEQWTTYERAITKGAMFDARCFNIPKEEVANLIYWRQLDATRNSIQMVGQANFSHKELQGKSCNEIQDMLMVQKGINWNDYPAHKKRGSCCIKSEVATVGASEENGEIRTWTIERPHWVVDTEIPIFKGEDRDYIEKLICIKEEEQERK